MHWNILKKTKINTGESAFIGRRSQYQIMYVCLNTGGGEIDLMQPQSKLQLGFLSK